MITALRVDQSTRRWCAPPTNALMQKQNHTTGKYDDSLT